MRVEILEPFRHDGQRYEQGDTVTVDDATGAYFCSAGWAKDTSGQVTTEPRDPNRVVMLDVDSATSDQKVEAV